MQGAVTHPREGVAGHVRALRHRLHEVVHKSKLHTWEHPGTHIQERYRYHIHPERGRPSELKYIERRPGPDVDNTDTHIHTLRDGHRTHT